MRTIPALLLCLFLLPATARPALLRYLRCDGMYFLCTIDEPVAQVYPLGPSGHIDSLAGAYLTAIQRQMPDKRLGLQLYRALLPEVLRQVNRLVICADGPLGSLPFECLVTDTAGPGTRYLVAQASILYTRNLKDFLKPATTCRSETRNLLALSPAPDNKGLPPLPYADLETDAAGVLFPGQQAQRSRLSRDEFFSLAPRYDILHLATHAQSDPLRPGRSCFFLCRAGQTDTVYADALQQLQLHTQLLILSACNSTSGLAPAFLTAGARNVVAAAWDIPDKCSAAIITAFYRHLRNGCDKARALQLAKLEYLAAADAVGAEPYCWAGLMLFGDAGPLNFRAASPQQAFIFDSLVCLAAAFGVYLSKKYIPGPRRRSG